ncbi:MAG: hypothetical protein GY810_16680 [Aureispira sp.]|nr:hypothetical protein [Aureispira sp.]
MNTLDENFFQEENEDEIKLLKEAFPKQKFSRMIIMAIAIISFFGCIGALMIFGNRYEILGKWVGLIASGSLGFGLLNSMGYIENLKLLSVAPNLFWKGEYLLWISILIALIACTMGLVVILSWQL